MPEQFIAVQIDIPQHPLLMRPNSSDAANYFQIFINRQYACTEVLKDVELVVDCGAYVGYSATWFLNKFPRCHVVAVEPDAQNFALLKANLNQYLTRVTAMNNAVFFESETSMVRVSKPYRDGKEWSHQFQAVTAKLPGKLTSITIDDILKLCASKFLYKIDLLKIDIEGTEAVLFSRDYSEWLKQVDSIAIELHDDTSFGHATKAFVNACSDQFTIENFGETTFARRRQHAR